MSSAQSVVHRDWSGRRAVGNDRRSFLVEPDTTCLVPLRQRIETGCIEPVHELERKPAAFPYSVHLTDMTSLCAPPRLRSLFRLVQVPRAMHDVLWVARRTWK
jgi:hypothetical protein